jgi:hypothetical protein
MVRMALPLGLDRVEVAHGEAKVLPFLGEDHVQAGADGMDALGVIAGFLGPPFQHLVDARAGPG